MGVVPQGPIAGRLLARAFAVRPPQARTIDVLDHPVQVLVELRRRHPQRLDPDLGQVTISPGVLVDPFRVEGAVKFYAQARLCAVEVEDVRSHRMLPAEVEGGPVITKLRPQPPLRFGGLPAEGAGSQDCCRTQVPNGCGPGDVRSSLTPTLTLPLPAGRGDCRSCPR